MSKDNLFPNIDGRWLDSDKDRVGKIKITSNGWVCPKCGRCWAPWIPECTLCNLQKKEQNEKDIKE